MSTSAVRLLLLGVSASSTGGHGLAGGGPVGSENCGTCGLGGLMLIRGLDVDVMVGVVFRDAP